MKNKKYFKVLYCGVTCLSLFVSNCFAITHKSHWRGNEHPIIYEMRDLTVKGKQILTEDEEHQLNEFDFIIRNETQIRKNAQRADLRAKKLSEDKSKTIGSTIKDKQLRRYQKMIARPFLNRLADRFK